MSLGMLGKYERLDVLGHGASSIVYLARDTLLRRTVAIKEIAAQGDEKTRFLEEARVLDRLRHPNIVRVNSVDTIGAKVVIDMEFVEGRNLQDLLRDADGPLELAQAVDIASQVCSGLAYAHAHHTVHRDVKPANILIGAEGRVKLVDFGLAEVLGTNSYAGGAGTYAYMAPEDYGSDARSDAQSDLWSVGVIFYEMLTGRRPFSVARPKDPFAWQRVVSEDSIVAPSSIVPELPPEVDRIALRALARDKSERYLTASALFADLTSLIFSMGLVTTDSPAHGTVACATTGEPSTPVVLDSATTDPPTLIGACDIDQFLNAATEDWDDARLALVTGALSSWLDDLGEEPLARVARQIETDGTIDDDQKLREFLYRAGVDAVGTARREAGIGSRLLRVGAFAEAVGVLRRALNLDPGHASYFLLLSRALTAVNDSAGAIEVLEQGVARYPRHGALRRELKQRGGAQVGLSHEEIDFGIVRQSQPRVQKVVLRNVGHGLLQGRVASLPGWISVTPMTFSTRHRQPLTIVADPAHLAGEPGEYIDTIVLETTGGKRDLDVRIRVLPPLLQFEDVVFWYLSLAGLVILPLVIGIAISLSHLFTPAYMVGMILSGLLSASLLGVTCAADAGWLERFIPSAAILLAPAGAFLFVQSSHAGLASATLPVVAQTILPAIVLLAMQAAAMLRSPAMLGRWQIWAGILAAASLALSCVLMKASGVG